MSALEINFIDHHTHIKRDWVGVWWLMSPDEEQELCVAGVGGTYAEALEGIQQAHEARVERDNPAPLLDWELHCERPCDHENFMKHLRSKCNDVA